MQLIERVSGSGRSEHRCEVIGQKATRFYCLDFPISGVGQSAAVEEENFPVGKIIF
jgi:hypothetical protein